MYRAVSMRPLKPSILQRRRSKIQIPVFDVYRRSTKANQDPLFRKLFVGMHVKEKKE